MPKSSIILSVIYHAAKIDSLNDLNLLLSWYTVE